MPMIPMPESMTEYVMWPEPLPSVTDVTGIVHQGWRFDPHHRWVQMRCCYTANGRLPEFNHTYAVTCIWCLSGHSPWLSWGPYERKR